MGWGGYPPELEEREEQVQGRGEGRVGLAVGGCKGFGCGGVGGRGTGPGTEQISQRVSHFCRSQRVQKEEKWLFLKDALWNGRGTHRSWPGERGGRPRALIPGEGVREGLAWRKGWVGTHRWTGGQGGGGKGSEECSTKKKKNGFF